MHQPRRKPAKQPLTVLSLFDGISCGFAAIKRCGIPASRVRYFASEIDHTSIVVAKSQHPSIVHIGDVRKVSFKDGVLHAADGTTHRIGHVHLLLAGSPCQGFSSNGSRKFFQDERSGLYRDFVRLLREVRPDAFLFENVPMPRRIESVITADLEPWGAQLFRLNSSLVSAQNRPRLYWTNIRQPHVPGTRKRRPKRSVSPLTLKNLVGKRYTGVYCRPHGFFKGGFRPHMDKSPCITKSGWHSSFFVYEEGVKRKFTVEECEQLQTLKAGYTKAGGSDSRRVAMIGNAWTVDMICELLDPFCRTYK